MYANDGFLTQNATFSSLSKILLLLQTCCIACYSHLCVNGNFIGIQLVLHKIPHLRGTSVIKYCIGTVRCRHGWHWRPKCLCTLNHYRMNRLNSHSFTSCTCSPKKLATLWSAILQGIRAFPEKTDVSYVYHRNRAPVEVFYG